MWVMRDLARVSRAMKSVYIEDGTGRVDTHKMAWLEGNRNLFLLIYKLAYQDDPDADLDGFDPEDFYQDFESRRENE